MFGTIRRHQTWLWLVIATITIVSMVAYLGPVNKATRGTGRPAGNFGSLNGEPITAEQLSSASKEFRLQYFLSSRGEKLPDSDSPAVTFEVYKRLFEISQLNELGIEPGVKAVAELAARITGSMSLDDFVEKNLKPQGLDANDFERFLRHELGIEQLLATAGLSGRLVSTQQAEALYRADHKELTTALVYFAATNFLTGVKVTSEAVTEFYTTNMNLRYHLRDRVQVDYVKFDNSNYLAAAAKAFTNLDKNVDDIYRQNGTNLFAGVTNEADIKAKLKEYILNQRASVDARRAAVIFAETLFGLTNGADSLEKLAKTNKLTLYSTAPFDDSGPKETNLPFTFGQAALQLTTNEPFGGPITNADSAFVLALKRKLPSEIEPLDQIKTRVTDDYRNTQAVKLAQDAATKFYTTLTNGLAQSNRFEAICSSANVKPESLPPLSLTSTNLPADVEDRVSLGLLQRVAFSTLVGSASQVVEMPDGAFILYVSKQTPVDETRLMAELPQFLAYLRQTRQNEAFNQWLFGQRLSQDRDFAKLLQDLYNKMQSKSPGARRSP